MTEYISWRPGAVIPLYVSIVMVRNRSEELHVFISKQGTVKTVIMPTHLIIQHKYGHFYKFPVNSSHSSRVQPFLASSSIFQSFPAIFSHSYNFQPVPASSTPFPTLSATSSYFMPVQPFPAIYIHLQQLQPFPVIDSSFQTILAFPSHFILFQTLQTLRSHPMSTLCFKTAPS